MRKLLTIGILLFLVTLVLYGQGFEGNFDFYEYSNKIWKSLKQWQTQDFKDSKLEGINLKEIFSLYDYSIHTVSSDTFRLDAELPIYMGILTTKLSLQFTKNLSNIENIKYIPNIAYCDGVISFDDSVKVKIVGKNDFSESIIHLLENRFYLYRTLGLPQELRPGRLKDSTGVKLFFHARNIDSLLYSSTNKWLQTMNRLSQNKIVFAGPTSVVIADEKLIVNFYVLITTEEAFGHHFFLIEEVLANTENDFSTESLTVDFYPYVRVDNLLSLYGVDSSRVERKPFPIKINR
ncbi:MAG: hypothetical protein KAW56_04695 [Candidatus Marinimicrobia bacterium]|nr:hypothetical protein [Candidatus Neomarinimicrobiota bacterium]